MSSAGWEGAFHVPCYFPCWNVKYSLEPFPSVGAFQRPQAPWEGATGLAAPGLWNQLNWLNLDLEIACRGTACLTESTALPSRAGPSEAGPEALWCGPWTHVAFFPLLRGRSS